MKNEPWAGDFSSRGVPSPILSKLVVTASILTKGQGRHTPPTEELGNPDV